MSEKIKLKEAISIYKERTGKKMNVTLLSKLIKSDLNPKTVWNYLQRALVGDKKLTPDIVDQVAQILWVSTDYLYGLSSNSSTPEMICKRLGEKIDEFKKEKDEMLKEINKW